MEQQREEEEASNGTSPSLWHELVDDLWTSKNNLEHLREDSSSVLYVNVFDPSNELYGFQTKPDNSEPELLPSKPSDSLDPTDPPSPKTEPEPPKPQKGLRLKCMYNYIFIADLSEYAHKLSKEDISDYLRDLKLDQYVEVFMEYEVDGGMLYDMDDSALEEALNVELKSDRFKIMYKYKPWLRQKFSLSK